MRALGIDLGTKTGFALSLNGVLGQCGTWVLSKPKEITYARELRLDRRADPRFLRLYDNLLNFHLANPLDYVIFEDVQFAVSVMASQLWSSLRSAVWLLSRHGVQIDCVPVGTLKKFASGNGGADKSEMARALAKADTRFKLVGRVIQDSLTLEFLTDDTVDAIWLAKWAIKNIKT